MHRLFACAPSLRRLLFAAIGIAVGGLAVAEAFFAPTPVMAIGIAVCGLLVVGTFYLPDMSRAVIGGVTALSAGFSIFCTQLPIENEYAMGLVEILALSWLGVRVILHHPSWRATGLFAAVTTTAVLIPLRTDFGEPAAPGLMDHQIGWMIGIAMGMAFMGLLGLYLRLRDRMRVDRREFDRQAQRLEYARDLHDFVAHHVTAIVAQTKAVRYTTAAGKQYEPAELDGLLAGIEEAGSEALTSMRGMISVLRGGSPAPTRPQGTLAEILTEATARLRSAGPRTTVTVDERLDGKRLPDATVSAARHVVQESLTNVLRHAAQVTRVDVVARIRPEDPDRLELTVTDDGHPHRSGHTPGFGLIGLHERTEAIGGHCVGERRDGGWRVTAVLPMRDVSALPSWRA